MSKDSPVVIVDTREPPYISSQLASFGLTVVEDTLETGDYIFYPHGLKVAIERKRIDDLLNSLRDNRMVSQAHRLIDEFSAAILLVEGRYDRGLNGVVTYEVNNKWVESGWSWDSFTGMMLDLKWMGLIFHQCMSGDAAREIARVVGSLCKEEHAWIKTRARPQIITIDKQWRNSVWSLCAFDGIGPEWAEAMLQKYGTLKNLFNTTVDQLTEITSSSGKKFGLKRAIKVRKEWDEKWTAIQPR